MAGDDDGAASARLRDAEASARWRAEQMTAVAAVGELAITEPSLRTMFDGAVALTAKALAADIVALVLLDGDELHLEAAVGLPAELVGGLRVSLADGSSIAAYTVRQSDAVIVTDLAAETRFTSTALREAGAVSGAAAILRGAGRVEGAVGAFTRHERTFDDDDINVLRSVANVFAHAIERDRAHQQLSRIAITDELTGLPNRVLFLDRLRHALEQRSPQTVGVAFGDLDAFKDVNEALGHGAGDQLLRETAARLVASVRDGDTVARFGGDEFAVLYEDVSGPEEVMALARRLTDHVASEPIQLGGRDIHVSMSVGVVVAERADAAPESLLRDADTAMYRAKSSGSGGVELFGEHLRASVIERMDLTNDLIAAIAADEFVVHYQPEIALAGDVVWAEALVRWQHPTRGLLAPGDFVELAEDTGLIVPIGQLVLEAAAAQMARWAELGPALAPSAVSVNLAARQLVESDLVGLTAGLLDRFGLDPGSLWFELTETTVLREPERSIATLHELKALGVGLALDDFGTGYSSLTYARTLPIDALKIDRSFISGMGTDLRDEGIVRATIGLARSFGVLTIAEGVETAEQLAELRELGCDFAQGYLLSCPSDAADIEAWTRTFVATGGVDLAQLD